MSLSDPLVLGRIASVLTAVAVGTGIPIVGQWWDAISRRYVTQIESQMITVGLDSSNLPLYLRLWGGVMLATVVSGFMMGLGVLSIPIVLIIFRMPIWILDGLLSRRRTLLRDQMTIASVALANAVRAGLALPQGIEEIIRETQEPLKSNLRQIHLDFHRGRPLNEAIDNVRRRLQLDSFTLFAHAINTCLDRGGKVTEALEEISRSLTDNQRIERKLEADTAAGRMTILLLSAAPLLFLIGFYFLEPSKTMLLFKTTPGQIVLTIVIVIVYGSTAMCRKILAIDI